MLTRHFKATCCCGTFRTVEANSDTEALRELTRVGWEWSAELEGIFVKCAGCIAKREVQHSIATKGVEVYVPRVNGVTYYQVKKTPREG